MNKVTVVLIFACGVLTGAVIDYTMLKKRFENRLEKEITEIKKRRDTYFDNVHEAIDTLGADIKSFFDEQDKNREETPTSGRYPWESNDDSSNRPESFCSRIEAKDFGELEGYSTEYLIWYKGGTLVDDYDKPIDNPDEVIGEENVKTLEEGLDDVLYIRNDKTKCDYQIDIDEQSFEDYVANNPYAQGKMEGFDE